jgi:carbamoyltransferase
MYILGISCYFHDAAAVLLEDGNLVAAAEEERFTRKKHDYRFPTSAVRYCLAEAGIAPGDLDHVGFYDKPFLKFERLLETYLTYAPRGLRSFFMAMPLWFRQKLHLPREMNRGLGKQYSHRFVFTDHHESHAASAFFPSPYEEAAILTLDGVGEWATASFGTGRGNRIELASELHFPHSLGLLYSAFTFFTGFRVNSGEYKLMGLAPYGEPKYADLIREKLMDLKDDGSFRLDMSYFNYCQGLTMTSKKMDRLFGRPPRKPESPLGQDDMDIAASIQGVTEEIMLRIARHVHRQTGMKRLCLAGGVALNCVGNGRILREGPFEDVWIQPAAGDAGGAVGTALFIWHQLLDKRRTPLEGDSQRGSLLGPQYSDSEVRAFFDQRQVPYHHHADEAELCGRVSELLASECVVGWMQGRMEFGPRALGGRSILGDPRSRKMQSVMNLKIKFRESFRPFAPSVLRERVADFFEMSAGQESPYMLLVAPVGASRQRPLSEADAARQGIDKLKVCRSELPAITHVDYSARVQTVDPVRHGRYYQLLKQFEEKTGCPVMINTSFNIRGEPIVCTPEDAYRCFMATDMDALVVENCLLIKEEQPDAEDHSREAYLGQFSLD